MLEAKVSKGSSFRTVIKASAASPATILSPTLPRFSVTPNPSNVCAVILGGGESDSRRLFPLTEKRTLPAIPIGGIYRLIDIPMSNCINSGIFKIYILTQYNSTSLNRYLTRTYDLSGGIPIGGDGFMEVVAATQSPDSQRWSEGPADSVRQWMGMLESNAKSRSIQDVIVLPSDQVYSLDFSKLLAFHRDNLADITIVCREVEESKAQQFGIVKVDKNSQITNFSEKPKGDEKTMMSMDWDELDSFLVSGSTELQPSPLRSQDGSRAYIASCGMYIFRRDVMKDLLVGKQARDFGKELIPSAIQDGLKVMAYHMDSFWDDIGGSIGDFHKLNIELTSVEAPFNFNVAHNPLFACPVNLPPSIVDNCTLVNTMVGPGCTLTSSKFSDTVIGARSLIGSGCQISESILMGADYYEAEKSLQKPIGPSFPPVGIGAGCTIHKALIDKNARIGSSCTLVNKEGIIESFDRIKAGICIRDGVLIVSKSSAVPDEEHNDTFVKARIILQIVFKAINTSKSAMFMVSFLNSFFESYSFSATAPLLEWAVHLKSILATFRTVKIQTMTMSMDTIDNTLHVAVLAENGINKKYQIDCLDSTSFSVLFEKDSYSTRVVAEASELNKLLGSFQSTLSELTMIANPSGISDLSEAAGTRGCQLKSFYDPSKGRGGTSLHTRLDIDTGSMFVDFFHRSLAPTDVTFNLKDFRAMVSLCEFQHSNVAVWFHKPGLPLIVEPHSQIVSDDSDFKATLILATMDESQIQTSTRQDGHHLTDHVPPAGRDQHIIQHERVPHVEGGIYVNEHTHQQPSSGVRTNQLEQGAAAAAAAVDEGLVRFRITKPDQFAAMHAAEDVGFEADDHEDEALPLVGILDEEADPEQLPRQSPLHKSLAVHKQQPATRSSTAPWSALHQAPGTLQPSDHPYQGCDLMEPTRQLPQHQSAQPASLPDALATSVMRNRAPGSHQHSLALQGLQHHSKEAPPPLNFDHQHHEHVGVNLSREGSQGNAQAVLIHEEEEEDDEALPATPTQSDYSGDAAGLGPGMIG
ncbi:hypothetical protein CEUSTIGMA_g12010.t1 [Chlamydomonas eustigma]|uniref:glucose-1-phosphate adenylyltransferase n=1 Tax=Chlamydomonas eustigma TaxID=1157962 RepID=A0A250XNR4_9CHLO|nr:hypothetical protein CEUSTIGMA_g12010.t1 [Chlamydomonas eustigma]|eukprot:GAX84589.1 hypothetical protein CEUSTIGMA_g12010.t1 [Chlamydomonas eustigma]